MILWIISNIYMLKIIKDLYPLGIQLLGESYDKALEYIEKILPNRELQIPLEIIEIKSGTKLEQWTVPDEWVVKDAWVKFKGEKILDYKKNPLCLVVYSAPFKGKMTREQFLPYLNIAPEVNAYAYKYSFYEKKWGFTIPHDSVYKDNHLQLEEGEYEIMIDTEFKPGVMKLGVHTIIGKSEREILLFAHLDHPYQANDNLSGVACLIDLAKKIKCEHTVKIIFCPETIGSIAYGLTQDISKVDFVIALDCIGNDNSILIQKAWDKEARINFAIHFALPDLMADYRKGEFRYLIGSDEYFFNDPKIGIPGIMLSRWPYPEYHTELDKPEIVKEEKLIEIQNLILKTIDIYEQDFIPVKNFKGPLMRSKYGVQTVSKDTNRGIDYLIYGIDGEKWLSRIAIGLGLSWNFCYDLLVKLEKDGYISRNSGKVRKSKTAK